ncbi:class I SAM-dependent methyltransferase [Alloiococcus sp. CFN-8]|uniref:class I SAM-dependent methyltransferase n=1 Tax=Alloiococcus sp. CFN-8 TaxID=3416081 RepID=UPI003CEE2C6D
MEYMGNKEYWEEKFHSRSDKPLNPESSLVENIIYLKKGSVLDVACGDGRNALYLLEQGFEVTGVDFSDKALERLKIFAERNNYFVNAIQADLSKSNSLENIGRFDNIVINHYRLDRDLLLNIHNNITEGGILFVSGFGYNEGINSRIRKEDMIQLGDFQGMDKFFELVKYEEHTDERGYFATYIFRKR